MPCAQGEELIREGEPASHLLLVLKGEAVVHSGGVEVNRIKAGGFTGEMAALDGHHYTATVVARRRWTSSSCPRPRCRGSSNIKGVARRLMGRVVGWLRPVRLPSPPCLPMPGPGLSMGLDHGCRAAGHRSGGSRPFESAGGCRTIHLPLYGRDPPQVRLLQARHQLPDGAGRRGPAPSSRVLPTA